MLKNYMTIAYRNLIKQRWFSLINVLGLSIGMTVAMLIGLWVYDELTYDTYHKNYDRLGQIMLHQSFNGEKKTSVSVPIPLGPLLKEEFKDDFKHISFGSWNWPHQVSYGDKHLSEAGMHVEPAFAEMLSLELIQGTMADALTEPNSIIMAEPVAKALYGDEDPYGKIIKYDNTSDLKVTGEYKDLPDNSSFKNVDILVPWDFYVKENQWVRQAGDQWDNHSFQLFAEIAPHTTFEAVSEKIKDVEKEFNPETKPEHFVFPMAKWHLYDNFENGELVGGRIQYVWLFGITGIFVLLLACINFMNLSTAAASKRSKEVCVKKVMGSGRNQLLVQFLVESFLATLVAMILAPMLVLASLPLFNEVSGKNFGFGDFLAPDLLLYYLLFGMLLSVLAGAYPAFVLSSFQPLAVLKNRTVKSGGKSIRSGLVIFQFALSTLLIIGTLVVDQQMDFILNKDIGYDKEGIVVVKDAGLLGDDQEVFKQQLLAHSQVENVSISRYIPAGPSNSSMTSIHMTLESDDFRRTPVYYIDDQYLPTM